MDTLKNFQSTLFLPDSASRLWQFAVPICMIILMITYFSVAAWYSNTYSQYTSDPASVTKLLAIRRQILGTAIDPLTPNTNSVCSSIITKTPPYSTLKNTALVNWRPLTVRLTGYLGGINSLIDGVFDMTKGVQLALAQGARSFVFDIDYLENDPCNPCVMYRDSKGYLRSLNTGSIKEACKTLADKAFTTNYDPVIIVIYLHKVPAGAKQQKSFFKAIAASLSPLSTYHLGSTENGSFHNCISEAVLFTSPITNYQKKFIVLTNYDTTILPVNQNPTDNLNFWTNARIYQDPNGISSAIGSVTPVAPGSPVAVAMVGASQQLLAIPSAQYVANQTLSTNTFRIALGSIDYNFSTTDIDTLMNQLGIQCVPLDVVGLSAAPTHQVTISSTSVLSKATLATLSQGINTKDPLSFWAYSGWSPKNPRQEGFLNPTPKEGFLNPTALEQEGFANPVAIPEPTPVYGPIPVFSIPTPVVPKRPPPSTNSNGGLISIG